MSGEFVRTPKKGMRQGRYRAAADLPITEIALCLVSLASTTASIETGHWFATPFALLFTCGYGYVAAFVAMEQIARRKAQPLPASASAESIPAPPPSAEELAA
jgi:hypothetical protein